MENAVKLAAMPSPQQLQDLRRRAAHADHADKLQASTLVHVSRRAGTASCTYLF